MEVDYELYAEGEALLGWLNATAALPARRRSTRILLLAKAGPRNPGAAGPAEIAHLKMTLSPSGGLQEIAVVNLVRSDFVPELSMRLEEPVTGGQLIINLRAEGAPEELEQRCARHWLAQNSAAPRAPGIFRPGKPQPTHRWRVPPRRMSARLELYCHCQYAQVVRPRGKRAVLQALCESGLPFEAVADLCEMSARKDPR